MIAHSMRLAILCAVLLPGLAGALASGDRAAFRGRLRGVLAATGAVVLAGVLGAAAFGPWLVRLAFGEEFVLGRGHLVVLAAATGCFMLAQVFQHGAKDEQLLGQVVDDEDAGPVVLIRPRRHAGLGRQVGKRAQRHSQLLSTANRLAVSTGLDR